ncbi:MAG: TonB-dependent receptor [Gammaproteobacteria bacterium]|uniref:TonB-dependent receptor n=1 Tax=Pseudomaricurvus alcaniphilus TaxID=1166482 RepID=UPI001407D2EB|nr:TonB-dependent receptor [Pseudomaricurvus alcaniphilus]MBR9911083.1 TonB-dependent receptor [Gammaproteobacteria bacterium]NHN36413.1 TonB-dependent receptor [Pseudomaricurvus alcaniphilus]
MLKRSILNLAISGIAAATIAAPTMAAIEEIIVTAQHREENLQDVPVSVTAMAGEMMEEADIRGATEVALYAPGMSYAEFAPGQALISLRGITSADDGPGMDNSVTAFLDGVYIGRPSNINFDLYDLERIEILRGPQGTLFGRNAIGGAINIVTSKPTEDLTVKGTVSVGNEGHMKYEGLVSGALAENLLGKVSFSHNEHDGYVRNVALNKDQADANKDSGRVQLLWHASNNTEVIFSADFMDEESEDMGRTPFAGPLNALAEAQGSGRANPHKVATPIEGGSKRDAQGANLSVNFDLGSGTLTSITAWRESETDWQMASSGIAGVFGADADLLDDIQEQTDQLSQELRWTSQLDGDFNFVAGLYYLQEETDRSESFRVFSAGPPLLETARSTHFATNETESFAAYGQASWALTNELSLHLGLRFTRDKKDVTALNIRCADDPATITDPFVAAQSMAICNGVSAGTFFMAESFFSTADESWEDVSPKVAVDYRVTDDVMIFGSIAKGFKSGGFPNIPPIKLAHAAVDPEEVINYEVGMKGDFFDHTVRLNLTAYYMDYTDLQAVRFGVIPGSGNPNEFFTTVNLGEAEIKGLEMEAIWAVTDNLQLSGNYAYLDTETKDFNLGNVDASGGALRQAPENTFTATVNYEYPIESGNLKFRLDYAYSDEQVGDYLNEDVVIEEFGLWNGRIAWQSSDEKWLVALWGKNLSDEEYISHAYNFAGSAVGVWGAPATYGVSVTWQNY